MSATLYTDVEIKVWPWRMHFQLSLLLGAVVSHATAVDIARLLANMTTAEKARQLVIYDGTTLLTDGLWDEAKAAAYFKQLGGGVIDTLGRNVDPYVSNALQRAAVNSSSNGIGVIIAEECQHGVQGDWHTVRSFRCS